MTGADGEGAAPLESLAERADLCLVTARGIGLFQLGPPDRGFARHGGQAAAVVDRALPGPKGRPPFHRARGLADRAHHDVRNRRFLAESVQVRGGLPGHVRPADSGESDDDDGALPAAFGRGLPRTSRSLRASWRAHPGEDREQCHYDEDRLAGGAKDHETSLSEAAQAACTAAKRAYPANPRDRPATPGVCARSHGVLRIGEIAQASTPSRLPSENDLRMRESPANAKTPCGCVKSRKKTACGGPWPGQGVAHISEGWPVRGETGR